jgi:hypothetical protein
MPEKDLSPAELAATVKHFLDAVVAAASAAENPLLDRIRAHLGAAPSQLPVIAEEFETFEHPNVQVALEAYVAADGRQAELLGIAAPNKRFMGLNLSDFLGGSPGMPGRPVLAEGPVDYVNFHLADGRILPCVQFGLYLIKGDRAPLVVFVTGPSGMGGGPRPKLRVEVMGTRREDCQDFLGELTTSIRRLNVYRGHVISLSPGQFGMGPQSLIEFHSLPKVDRDDVVLPDGLLERIERQTIVFSQHADELRAGGRSLKRGLLLYGLPGTGKTLTVMYLTRQMAGRTVILTTGRGMGLLQTIALLARQLAPSMVVIEDVDLIAEERGRPMMPTGPLLFELLNEMDGLRDDQDVIFVLTTNRPDILEPALAARPGRIDLVVELPLPDAGGRRKLFTLYGRGLSFEGVQLDRFVERTEGVSPAYIKELLRKAALLSAEQGLGATVRDEQLSAAMEELSQGGRLAERILGFRPQEAPAAGSSLSGAVEPLRPTGFPASAWSAVVKRQP